MATSWSVLGLQQRLHRAGRQLGEGLVCRREDRDVLGGCQGVGQARSLCGGDQGLEAAGLLGSLDDVGGGCGCRAEAKCCRGRKKDLVHEYLQLCEVIRNVHGLWRSSGDVACTWISNDAA